MNYLVFLFCCTLLWLWGCTAEPKAAELPVKQKVEVPTVTASISLEPAVPNFQNSEGRFQVYFPASPQRLTPHTQVDIGTVALTQYLYQPSPYQLWSVSYADYPKALFRLGKEAELLEGVQRRLVSDLHARPQGAIQWDSTTTWTDLRFSAHMPRQDAYVHYYLLLQGQRLYQVGLHSVGAPISEQDSLDFFGSFGLWK